MVTFTYCEDCAHKEVCKLKEAYQNIADTISDTIIHKDNSMYRIKDYVPVEVNIHCTHMLSIQTTGFKRG